jgi:hypothetical protein
VIENCAPAGLDDVAKMSATTASAARIIKPAETAPALANPQREELGYRNRFHRLSATENRAVLNPADPRTPSPNSVSTHK